MSYRIIVTKREANPEYAKQMEDYEKRNRFNGNYNDPNAPQPTFPVDALITELTDDQFLIVQKEIIKAFK